MHAWRGGTVSSAIADLPGPQLTAAPAPVRLAQAVARE
eukprot:COSAG05_NODE_7022_length_865_cov_1.143603_1_plen_37_part_10